MFSRVKAILPRTLFARALLIIVTPLVLVQIVALIVFFDLGWDTVARRAAAALAGDIGMTIEVLTRNDDPAEQDWTLRTASQTMNLQFTLDRGARLREGAGAPAGNLGVVETRLNNALARAVQRPYAIDFWTHPSDFAIDVQIASGVLRVMGSRGRLISSPLEVVLQWIIGTALIAFAIASIFMRNQVRPIQRLAAAAEAFGKGRDFGDLRPSGAREVRQASAAFIVMRDRIRRFLQQRTEMLAGVSHDLRTPLTRMKLGLALLGNDPLVAGLKSDVADMERMVESYLNFARGEGGEQAETVDLRKIIDELADAARRGGAPIEVSVEGDLTVSARPQAIKRSLENLLTNAQRHAGRITLTALRQPRQIEITIDDDGPGIPVASREEVFKPFFRLDSARGSATGSVGLGLTIARDAIRGHGGEVTLTDSPLGGLRARVTLPV
jgi:two-component system, OmpR family, osmolarity sensor histidine kinase EnvZ